MIKSIFQGVRAYFQSFHLISKLKLWKYFSIPILISIVIGFLIVFISYSLSDDIGGIIAKIWIWDFGKETFGTIGTVLGGLIIILIGLIIYKHIVMALVSPFMSPVSEKIEKYYHQNIQEIDNKPTHRKTSFHQQLVRGIRINSRNLSRELFFTVLLLLLGLIPVVNLVSTVLLFVVQAYYAGFGSMDYTLERHFNYKESIAFVRKNKGIAIGNGLVFVALLMIPVIGFILVLPLSVTASSIKTIEKIHN